MQQRCAFHCLAACLLLAACKSEGTAGDGAVVDVPVAGEVHAGPFSPAAGQTTLFSWGRGESGMYREGRHWEVRVTASGEIQERSGSRDAGTSEWQPHGTVPVSDVLRYYDLAMQAREGAQVWGDARCRDTGGATFTVYTYDPTTGKDTGFALQHDGDRPFVNIHPAAAQVRSWLVSLLPTDFDTITDCTFTPKPVSNCQACGDSACVLSPTGARYCSTECYLPRSECLCAGGPSWIKGDQAKGFSCADPG
jgi:hypothetical protein